MSTIARGRHTTLHKESGEYWEAACAQWDELAKGLSLEVAREKQRRFVGFSFPTCWSLHPPRSYSRADCKQRALSRAANSMAPTGFHRVALGAGYDGTGGKNGRGTKAPNMLVSLRDTLATRRQLYSVDEFFTSQRCPRVCECVCVCVCVLDHW